MHSNNRSHTPIRWLPVVIILLPSTAAVADDTWLSSVRPFLSEHCLDCHEGADAEAGLDLGRPPTDLSDAETLRRWVRVHDRIQAGEMPPDTAPQPSAQAVNTTLRQLAATLNRADRRRSDVVLRRLNRVEYENTVRDLFDVVGDVQSMLPPDTSVSGFDNVGEGLAVSPEALQAYLRAAQTALDAAWGPGKPPRKIRHVTNLLEQTNHDGTPRLAQQIGKMFRKTDDGLVIFQSGYCPTNLVNFARLRAPVGTYHGTMRVRAVQSDKPVTLRIYAGDTIVGRREKHLVGYYDVPPDEWTTIEFTDRLVEAGGTFQPKCYGTRDTRKDADTYPEPGIEIGQITIEGPLEAWPPRSRTRLLGNIDPSQATLKDARTILRQILPRAFRRPIAADEVEPYLSLARNALEKGRSFEDALRIALQAVLCSPEFLFLEEPDRDRIGPHALAARLSYFLWSSMPDEPLRRAADQGNLSRPDELRRQVERMLRHPKADAFVEHFTGQWLDLREIDFTEPDQKLYPEFDELLKISMVEETRRFFREVLTQDLNVMTLVDSDFTILNERLARHYGIEGVEGQAFRKVTLPPDSVRGGVLTQASVLKVTANGTTTSPVLRGVWVLENVFGQHVPPPPANVPAVEPDIRGATTLRQQLARHRNDAACAVCHDRIDPAGFALENFDVIGGWRTNYRTLGEGRHPGFSQHPLTHAWVRYRIGLPVDASGKTADGQTFADIRAFKKLLRESQPQVVSGLARKLLTYALGRQLGFSDRPHIERLVDALEERGNGLRTLIHLIVQSELFQRP